MRITPLPQGIELYYPAARTPAAALWLAAFGLACFIAGAGAAIAVVPLAQSGPAGALALTLMSIFIVPFVAFGVIFPLLALYLMVTSLTVTVTGSDIRSLRRICGVPLTEEHILNDDITALDATNPLRYRWPRQEVYYFNLVARAQTAAGGESPARRLVLAEGVRGREVLDRIREEIVRAAGLQRLDERDN